jgi:hypothetical protein
VAITANKPNEEWDQRNHLKGFRVSSCPFVDQIFVKRHYQNLNDKNKTARHSQRAVLK